MIDRRYLLRSAGLGAGAMIMAGCSRMAFAQAATDKRLVFIIQRGAMDGLSTLAPIGDPGFDALRGRWEGDYDGQQRIGGMFAIHPALQRIGAMFGRGEALFQHAATTGYTSRSHFDGQDRLELGGARETGWLNRLLGLLPDSDSGAIALAPNVPETLRGPNPVSNFTPSSSPMPTDDLLQRISMMYAPDTQLDGLWKRALETHRIAEDGAGEKKGAEALGAQAAQFLLADNGARIAMIETGGWDTHFAQPARLSARLKSFDALVGALRDGLEPVWDDTLVLVATEFGRTARINGTNGTDHGVGGLAMVMGGSLGGGKIVGEWPGLAPASLFENRDLFPANPLENLFGGAIAGHYGADPERVMRELYPQAKGRALEGLVA